MSNKKTFYGYFKESMDSLGLPAPSTLFSSATTASGTASTVIAVVQKFGTTATVAEIVATAPGGILSTAFAGEALAVVGGVTAAFYAGACIGALAYATGQYTADVVWVSNNGYQVGDLVNRATVYGITIPQEMISVLAHNPQLRRSTAVSELA